MERSRGRIVETGRRLFSGGGLRPLHSKAMRPLSGMALLASGALALVLGCSHGQAVGGRASNLLVFLLDTTRADHLGCYGQPGAATPVIDSLAARGVLFSETRSHSSLTPVSASTLLTGVLPTRHGVRSLFLVREQEIAPGVGTLAESLSRSGRRTAAFVAAAPMGARYGLDRGFGHYSEGFREHAERLRAEKTGNPYQRRADEVADDAIAWLSRSGQEPFGVLLHFFDPHDGALVPPRDFLEPRLSMALPEDFDRRQHLAGIEDPDLLRELYRAEIAFVDREIGRVLDSLEERGLLEETLVVVAADHGEGLGQHDFWTHGLLWDEQLRVPLILAGAGLPEGRIVAGRARLVDLVPTLAELLALTTPGPLDGESLLPWIEDPTPAEERALYAEVHHAVGDRLGRDTEIYSLSSGGWKLVHRPATGLHELYNIAADPGELENLHSATHPVARMLASQLVEMGAVSGEIARVEDLSAEDRSMLEALGYL